MPPTFKDAKFASEWLSEYLKYDSMKLGDVTAERDVAPYVKFMMGRLDDRQMADDDADLERLNIALCHVPNPGSVTVEHRVSRLSLPHLTSQVTIQDKGSVILVTNGITQIDLLGAGDANASPPAGNLLAATDIWGGAARGAGTKWIT